MVACLSTRGAPQANRAVEVLEAASRRDPNSVHAWDTEVAGLDVMKQSPAHNGTLLCMSCYAGPDVEFELGKTRLWVDCYDAESGGVAAGEEPIPPVLEAFKAYFADEAQSKVWHNYSFDGHILLNYDVSAAGLAGDTMHMARLWDSSLGHDFE